MGYFIALTYGQLRRTSVNALWESRQYCWWLRCLLSMQFAVADHCEFFSEIKSNKMHFSSFLNIDMQSNMELILAPKPFNNWFHPQFYFHINCGKNSRCFNILTHCTVCVTHHSYFSVMAIVFFFHWSLYSLTTLLKVRLQLQLW